MAAPTRLLTVNAKPRTGSVSSSAATNPNARADGVSEGERAGGVAGRTSVAPLLLLDKDGNVAGRHVLGGEVGRVQVVRGAIRLERGDEHDADDGVEREGREQDCRGRASAGGARDAGRAPFLSTARTSPPRSHCCQRVRGLGGAGHSST